MADIFEKLAPPGITIHEYLNLQEAYKADPNSMSDEEITSYKNRLALRLKILMDFAKKNALPANFELVKKSIPDAPEALLKDIFESNYKNEDFDEKNRNPSEVILFNGGPASGKSYLMARLDLPKNTVHLDRDSLFPLLTPYERLQKEAPEHAVHAVVTEAIMYNERDAYTYALLCGVGMIIVDGTMSYLDLGIEMIKRAQEYGYKARVININIDLDVAQERAAKRAIKKNKLVNPKLLKESHVRCAYNFFEYVKIADACENWDKNGEKEDTFLFGTSKRRLKSEAGDIEPSSNIKIYEDGDHIVIYEILDEGAYNKLVEKSQVELKDVSWAPNYEEFLAQRKE